MKYTFLLLFSIVILPLQSQEETYIVWDNTNLLEWKDFQGIFEENGTLALAKTTYKIEIQQAKNTTDKMP